MKDSKRHGRGTRCYQSDKIEKLTGRNLSRSIGNWTALETDKSGHLFVVCCNKLHRSDHFKEYHMKTCANWQEKAYRTKQLGRVGIAIKERICDQKTAKRSKYGSLLHCICRPKQFTRQSALKRHLKGSKKCWKLNAADVIKLLRLEGIPKAGDTLCCSVCLKDVDPEDFLNGQSHWCQRDEFLVEEGTEPPDAKFRVPQPLDIGSDDLNARDYWHGTKRPQIEELIGDTEKRSQKRIKLAADVSTLPAIQGEPNPLELATAAEHNFNKLSSTLTALNVNHSVTFLQK